MHLGLDENDMGAFLDRPGIQHDVRPQRWLHQFDGQVDRAGGAPGKLLGAGESQADVEHAGDDRAVYRGRTETAAMPRLNLVQPDGDELRIGQIHRKAEMHGGRQTIEGLLPLNSFRRRPRHGQGSLTVRCKEVRIGHGRLPVRAAATIPALHGLGICFQSRRMRGPASHPVKNLHYSLIPSDPRAHCYTVTCTVDTPNPSGQVFSLPAWTPGSYLIRDHARHVTGFRAECRGTPVTVRKLDKSSWQCAPCAGPLLVCYELYARDDSVRAAWLDATRGYFNGAAVFLRIHGHEHLPLTLELAPPCGLSGKPWRVATTLRRQTASEWAFGEYAAADYAELIDHPVEMGDFDVIEFEAANVPHRMVLSGRHHADTARLAADLHRLCTEQLHLFELPAPMERYLFLTRVVKKGYGGLEHRNASALICSRDDLPVAGDAALSRGYRSFLGLCSHEYFHLWNIKRIRPQALAGADLGREAYTEDLWAYEGVTSYYDELALIRAGLLDVSGYCELLAEAATRLWRTPGRRRQSLAEASFDAWIKFYRPDENTPNTAVSYYNKGALVALSLDLKLRLESEGRCDLDQIMRALWRRYGITGTPAPERALEAIAQEVSGLDLRNFFERMIRGTDDPPLAELLPLFGVETQLRHAPGHCGVELGLRLQEGAALPQVLHVFDGMPARNAGLAPGDVLVAIDGLRVEGQELDRVLSDYAAGDRVRVHAFRGDELMAFEVTLAPRAAELWQLRPLGDADDAALARRKAWLRQ